MATYAKYQSTFSAAWMQAPFTASWFAGKGALKDYAVVQAKAAVKCRFPTYAANNGDNLALSYIGAERLLPSYPGESTTSYGNRLLGAWNAWPFAGSAYGILNQLWNAGYTSSAPAGTWTAGAPSIVQQNGLMYSLDVNQALVVTTLAIANPFIQQSASAIAGSANENLLGQTGATRAPSVAALTVPWWSFPAYTGAPANQDPSMDANQNQFTSRFALWFFSPPTQPGTSGWTNIVNPPTTNSAPAIPEVNLIRSIVTLWRAGKATCVYIGALSSGNVWGQPGLTWGGGQNWGGSVAQWAAALQ